MKTKKRILSTVASLEQEGEFYLLRVKPKSTFRYIAGQFVKIYLDAKSKEFEPLSFFSAPEEKEILFMFRASSPFKTALTEKKNGSRIYLEGPYGDFTVSKTPTNSVLLCKGMGLIPISSIGKSLIDHKKKFSIYILYENLERKDIVDEERLVEFDKDKQVNILMTLLNERPMEWPGKLGPITADMIAEFVPSPKVKDYYICGPATFVNRITDILGELKVPKKRIRSEQWD